MLPYVHIDCKDTECLRESTIQVGLFRDISLQVLAKFLLNFLITMFSFEYLLFQKKCQMSFDNSWEPKVSCFHVGLLSFCHTGLFHSVMLVCCHAVMLICGHAGLLSCCHSVILSYVKCLMLLY